MDVFCGSGYLLLFNLTDPHNINLSFIPPKDLHSVSKKNPALVVLSAYLGVGVDVGQVSGNTGGVDNVVEGKVGDQGRLLEEERQRLSDTAGSTENSDP